MGSAQRNPHTREQHDRYRSDPDTDDNSRKMTGLGRPVICSLEFS